MNNTATPTLGLRRPPRFWLGWTLALALTVLAVLLATLPPYVGPAVREALMHGFAALCHQLPSRSPHIDGVQLAVCHRCYGVYGGLPVAVVGFLLVGRWAPVLRRRAGLVLVLALLPLSIDWLLGVLGLWHNTPLSRTATGAVFGLVAGLYVAHGFAQAFVPRPSPAPAPELPNTA